MLMSHNDHISNLPDQFEILASMDNCQIAPMASINRKIYALQYHPEVEYMKPVKKFSIIFYIKFANAKATGPWTLF